MPDGDLAEMAAEIRRGRMEKLSRRRALAALAAAFAGVAALGARAFTQGKRPANRGAAKKKEERPPADATPLEPGPVPGAVKRRG